MEYQQTHLICGIKRIVVDPNTFCYATTWPSIHYYSTYKEAIETTLSYFRVKAEGYKKNCAGLRKASSNIKILMEIIHDNQQTEFHIP